MSINPQEQILALIRRAEKILCVTQSPAKTDGICCALAMQNCLKKIGKEIVIIAPEGLAHQYNFLPGEKEVETALEEKGNFVISLSTKKAEVERVKYTIEDESVDIIVTPKSGNFAAKDVIFKHHLAHFDLIITLDTPNLNSLGTVFSENTELFAEYPIINISSDPSTEDFGRVNLVDPAASSSAELCFNLLKKEASFAKLIDEDIATILLSGVIVSTGSFLDKNVCPSSFQAANELQALGGRQSEIIDHFFKQKSLATLKIWGKIFGSLQLDPVHRIAWSQISQNDLSGCEANIQDIDKISDEILRFIQPVDFSVLVIEDDNQVITQVRSNQSHVNWQAFSEHFTTEDHENGINIITKNSSLTDTESQILSYLLNIQKQKLNIDYELPIQKKSLEPEDKHNHIHAEINLKPEQTKAAVKPTPPADVPFDAPLQPHESTGKLPESPPTPPGTQSAEVTIDKKGVPEWLKKSFPEN